MTFNSESDTFSFSLNSVESGEYSGTFYSSNEEKYTVNIKRNGRNYVSYMYYECYSLIISWKKQTNKLIRLRSCESSNVITSDIKLFTKRSELSASFEFKAENRNAVVVLSIIPFVNLPKYVDTKNHLKETDTEQKPVVQKRLDELSTDMEILLQTGNRSDVILTDGSTEIEVHKLILSVRSSVFAKMFQHMTKENLENRIIIKDIAIEVLKGMLNFIYTGTITIKDMKMARDLYVAADKYDIQNLKRICSDMLLSVDLENVIDTLLLADLYGDKTLKQAAQNFIANNYCRVKELEIWSSFTKENQALSIELLSFVLDKKI